MRRAIPASIVFALFAVPALAKLPAPSDDTKAKAAQAAAKAAWSGKVGAYQLCRVEDKLAAQFRGKSSAHPAGGAASGGATAGAAAHAPMAAASSAGAAGSAPSPQVAAATPPKPCVDPGPFVATASAEPIEASGAHSPAKTATAPPSSNATAAEIKGSSKK